MDKRTKIIISLFVIVLLGIIVSEVIRPKPLNWKPSYTAADKIPFGCFVLYNELSSLFPERDLITVDKSLFEVLNKSSTTSSSYLMINNGIELDEQEYDQLLNYVSKGNEVFIASSYFGQYLSDTLKVKVQSSYTVREDTLKLTLTNSKFKEDTFFYTKGMYNRHFASVDTLNTDILGHMTFTKDIFFKNYNEVEKLQTAPNFIKVKFGNGSFYLNSTPLAFSNFYMLGGNQNYVANSLSYLANKNSIYWDDYKKSGRIIISSPMRFVLKQAPLKWAYYSTILGILLFFLFKTKREQRIIPIVEPLQNSSVEFAKTVGSLYYHHKDYTNLISKKLNYLLAHIRNKYYLEISTINDQTAKNLAVKSGKSLEETLALVSYIKHIKSKSNHSENDLVQLSKKISAFKK